MNFQHFVDESISKSEIEKLRELEEEVKKNIKSLKDSPDLPDTGWPKSQLLLVSSQKYYIIFIVKISVEKLWSMKISAEEYLKGTV